MQLFDWFYRQRVTEGEMDAAHGATSTALKTLRTTQIEGVWMGALWGDPPLGAPQTPTQHAPQDMTVDIPGPLRAWDTDGNLIFDPTIAINVNCAEDYQGTPTVVLLGANEKWVTICVAFDWDLSDPRVDGNGATVYYQKDPSLVYEVYQGAEALIGAAVVPAIPTDRVIICDVLLHWNDLTIATADIDLDRLKAVRKCLDRSVALAGTGIYTNFTATGFTLATGPTVGDAIDEIDGWMTGHLDGSGDHHDSDDIDFDNAISLLVATDVKGALDEIDNTVDGLVAGSAMLDTNVRFEGILVDPTQTDPAQTGWLEVKATTGGLLVEGDPGGVLGTNFSGMQFSPAIDGSLVMVQGQNAANVGIFFNATAYTDNYAAWIQNALPAVAGTPRGLLAYCSDPSDISVGIYTQADKGRAFQARYGVAGALQPTGLKLENWGGDATTSTYGVLVEDQTPAFNTCLHGYGIAVRTESAEYTGDSYGAYLQNMDAGATGYVGLAIVAKDGIGIQSVVEAGTFFDVTCATGELGTLECGSGGIGGLLIQTDNATTYGLMLASSGPGDTITSLLHLSQNMTGLMMSGYMDPAQDSISLAAVASAGVSAKAGIKVDYALATTNDPVPFWGVTRTDAGYAFYAEKGMYAAKSPLDADVFTWGAQDDVAWSGQQWQAKLNAVLTGIACDYVSLAKDLEIPTSVLDRDNVTKRRIATAWAQCAAAGGITGGHFNVLTVTNTAVGTYAIALDVNADAAMTGRAVVVTTSDRGTEKDAIMACVTDPLTNPIVVKLRKINDDGAGNVDIAYVDEDFSFVVFQDQ